ncbi:DUF2332 domain-containing protein [Hoyosella sp. YIM 151337]|uniref:DUF2332 domain-containing protein n=1 Tax=Hoyosella sp. YIM 151337 TaxID=2992742 RepID=UPI002235519E|nr:DUF2332 domain-containing protein [Hoyosella sp. YIM 151337]MCW4355815.1 DUF2332 domain-containing protein [Hoyosella sp. YIM 151337]
MRLRPEARDHIALELRFQSDACARLGSALYSSLMARAAQNAQAGGIIAELLEPYVAKPRGAAVALRLFGSVHLLALKGLVPELARWYPSCGGTTRSHPDTVWQAFAEACEVHREAVAEGLTHPPQTNEPGRGAALRGGMELTAERTGLPLRLNEIGASAGLNLRADLFRVGTPEGFRGPADSPVLIPGAWVGNTPPSAALTICERRGCDLEPISPVDDAAALRLQSYVWPDQQARFERLRGALELARAVPADVAAQSAEQFLAGLEPEIGCVTVIQHSVMWQYLPDSVRAACTRELARLRAAATSAAPVAHIALEPRRVRDDTDVDYHGFEFTVTWACWPYQEEHIVAYASPHGPPIHWE